MPLGHYCLGLRQGYVIWGGPPAMGPIDGTIVPAATGGSLPFLPDATMRVLRTIHDHYSGPGAVMVS